METFGIVCNARTGKGIRKLALVDRSKSKRLWWTSDDPTIAIEYRSKNAAEFACSRLKHNRPSVVPFSELQRILEKQSSTRRRIESEWCIEEGRIAMEAGWDGHKNAI